MTRRAWLILLGLLIAQFVAVAVYLAVDRERATADLSTAPPRATSGQVTSFEVTTRDGDTRELVSGQRPVLVHFWATWCPPCLDELPLLLAVDDVPFEVVAVALDPSWSAVDEFAGARHSPRVVLADRARAETQFELTSLPQTVLMSPEGEVLLRVNGARDWSDPTFLAAWSSDK